jgi:hypothetical protein
MRFVDPGVVTRAVVVLEICADVLRDVTVLAPVEPWSLGYELRTRGFSRVRLVSKAEVNVLGVSGPLRHIAPILGGFTVFCSQICSQMGRHCQGARVPPTRPGRCRAPCVGEDLSVSDSHCSGRCAAPMPPASPRAIAKRARELTTMDKAVAAKITTRCVWCPPRSGERAHCHRVPPLTHTEFKTENGIGSKSCNPLGTA